jgi:hypothetical protein
MVHNKHPRRYGLSYGLARPHYTAERCPRCSRRFTKSASVLKHLNHPRSKCARAWFPSGEHVRKPDDLTSRSVDDWEDHWEPGPLDGADDDAPGAPTIPETTNMAASLQDCYSEPFPAASETFGRGKTFMDRFDSDQFMSERKANLYYPFASEMEWELASFLQRSCLSLKAINQFLALKMVSVVYSSPFLPCDRFL